MSAPQPQSAASSSRPAPSEPTARRRVRTGAGDALIDVARAVCRDARLVALLQDLNPTLATTGPLPAGTVVVCPSETEARAFARSFGFTLGFDERASNGTLRRRQFARLHGERPRLASSEGAQAFAASASPEALARAMLAAGIVPAEAARRLVCTCEGPALDRFVEEGADDLALVRRAVEPLVLLPRAQQTLRRIESVLDATLRPFGFTRLIEACGRDADVMDAILGELLVPAQTRHALREKAPVVVAALIQARVLAAQPRGARELATASALVRGLTSAVVDGVPPLSGDRVRLAALDDVEVALRAHLTRIREMLVQAREGMPRSTIEVVRAVARGASADRAARPWPLIAAVARALSPRVRSVPTSSHDDGLAGLVGALPATTPAPAVVSVATLQARAAHGARAADEGDGIVERLAPIAARVLAIAIVVPADAIGPHRRARRLAILEHALASTSAPSAEALARGYDLLADDARRTGEFERVTSSSLAAGRDLARALTGNIAVHRRCVAEIGRAVLALVAVVDATCCRQLARQTGREGLVRSLEQHGGRVLARAMQLLAA